ncbi:MAG: AarF/ABC1/UbiB kinase family protein [Myxococcales bacterium]|nr:AarF/ABC1/UbiB kinase family protein [Myxococcales bacterium]
MKALTRSWGGRTLASGKVAATLGKSAVKQALGHADDGALGLELLDQLDRMKGLALKVGQMASYLEGALPPESARALEKLQHRGDPMAWESVQAVLEGSLGAPVGELFDAFDPEPVAAASIGQVHRATLEGRDVAVKVQFPGVRDTLAVDLGNLSRVGALARFGFPDAAEVVAELRERFEAECDYVGEARHTALAGRLLADRPAVVVPDVVPSRSTDVVLTTSWVEGRSFRDFLESSTQEERDRVGEELFRTAFDMLFGHGVFNADPHPGNLLFPADGRVALLDWGCVCTYDAEFVEAWKALARVTLDGRREELAEVTARAGFFVPGTPFDLDAHWEIMQYLYRPFLTPGFRYTPEYVAESWRLFLVDNPNIRHTRLPRTWVFANRLQWGLNSVLASLGATADWGGMFRAAVETPLVPAGGPAADGE